MGGRIDPLSRPYTKSRDSCPWAVGVACA